MEAANITLENVIDAVGSAKNISAIINQMRNSALREYNTKMEEFEYYKTVFLTLVIIIIIVLFFDVIGTGYLFFKVHRNAQAVKSTSPNF